MSFMEQYYVQVWGALFKLLQRGLGGALAEIEFGGF